MKTAHFVAPLAALVALVSVPAQAKHSLRDDVYPSRKYAASIRPAVENNETLFTWPKTGSAYARLRFTQNGNAVVVAGKVRDHDGREGFRLKKLISRRLKDGRLGNDYTRFQNFTPGEPVKVEVWGSKERQEGFSFLGVTEVRPVVHAFDPEVYGSPKDEVRLDAEFKSTAEVGETVTISGRVNVSDGLRADAFVVSPSGFPERIALDADVQNGGAYGAYIPSGREFRLSFRAEREGVYTVEINNYRGIASVNAPVYVGSGVPLIPNTLDFQGFPSPGAPVDEEDIKGRWIELINRDRAAFGLEPVTLDEGLSRAAQTHIDDMTRRDYFSHTGLDGSTPTTRAQRAGVGAETMVGENLGQGMGIEDLQAQLMASAVHRANLLNPNWKRVGLGVGRYDNGLLVGAQELGATAGQYDLAPDYFTGVRLDGELPTGIDAGERVTLSGTVTKSANSVTVFFQNKRTGRNVTFQPEVIRNGRFSVKLKFSRREAGPYLMGISLNGGSSRAASVVVRA